MAKYKETVHTDKAFALIGKMVAGKISELEFTKIKVSDKDYSKHTAEELKKLTALEQIKQETLVSEKTPVGDNAVNIHGIIYNTDLQSSYYLKTIGVYANDPDEGEILYSVTSTEVGDYIPTPNGNNITTAIIDILTEISDAEVNLSGNPSALVDVTMLNKKLDRGEGLEKEFDNAVKIVTELKKKQDKNDNALLTVAKNIVGAINELFSGKANKAHSHGNSEITDIDASKIKTGTIDISRLPQAALERCVVVADDTARFKLTKSQVQVGDSVKVTNPDNLMYIVVDDNKLNVEAGYVAYSAAIKWDGIKDKPSTFPPSSHTQDWSTITGKPSSFAPNVHTHDDRYYTESEINTKLNGKANSSHTHTKNQITDFPTTLKNPTALTIQANGASLGSYDGSVAKTFNVTASNIGASPSNHTHTAGQVGAYTKGEIDTKFKNLSLVPVPVGGVLAMYTNTNPAEIYSGTTWELLTAGKYIQSGSTALSTGGTNSVSINKANLPNVKLSIGSFSATIGAHNHYIFANGTGSDSGSTTLTPVTNRHNSASVEYAIQWSSTRANKGRTSDSGNGTTGSVSPSTETLGSGTALTIQPAYITLKFWKRLT